MANSAALVSAFVLLVCFVSPSFGSCPGICQPNSYYCPTYYTSGLCPGGNDVQCCNESTPSCNGQCQQDSISCSGTYASGLCPGGNDIECCESSVTKYSGVDVSDTVSTSDFSCLKGQGYDFVIARCWHSYGAVDTSAPQTIANAHAMNMSRVDVYMFPCPTCGDPAGQVQKAVSYLATYNANYTGFWLDVEGGSDYWYSSYSSNQNFFEGLINEANALGLHVGVYTSASQWNPIMGTSYTGGSRYPLWYAHYDNKPSFSDFSSFGGWSSPAMKQYDGDITVCGVGLDTNWSPTLNF